MTNIAHSIIGLTAQTAIHAGASSNEDMIDLPIQRESHSDWPVIYGSSMKGAWRSKAEPIIQNSQLLNAIFGPDTDNAGDHAAAIMVSDARLLLLPVRSLNSHFKWVTCPALLKRFAKDAKRLEQLELLIDFEVNDQTALTLVNNDNNKALYLEEFKFTCKLMQHSNLVDTLTQIADIEAKALTSQLVVISDDQFRHFCRAAIPVQTRIAIESDKKVVTQGALWTEESLPPETVMYNCISFSNARNDLPGDAAMIKGSFFTHLLQNTYLQVGGNATLSMGWFTLKQFQE